MIRTQVYITSKERHSLAQISQHTGKSQSELIREAIDLFCEVQTKDNHLSLLRCAKGIWEKRTDLPNFSKIRKELDRDWDEE